MGRLIQTALAEATGGAAAGIVADSVLYAVDSAKVRAQSKPVAGSGVSILFRGLVPTILLGSVPVFGSFFFMYAPIRDTLQENGYKSWIPLASAGCAIPATVIGVPSDVLKKRLVLGVDPNIRAAILHVTAEQGWKGLFAGWHVNLIKDLPFAAVKVGLYEYFVLHYKDWYNIKSSDPIPPVGASICGVASGICCAVVTCPLDVVNTRIKAGTVSSTSIFHVGSEIIRNEGTPVLFRGVVMRSIVLGVGSSIFWPIQRVVSHRLQPFNTCPVHDLLYEL